MQSNDNPYLAPTAVPVGPVSSVTTIPTWAGIAAVILFLLAAATATLATSAWTVVTSPAFQGDELVVWVVVLGGWLFAAIFTAVGFVLLGLSSRTAVTVTTRAQAPDRPTGLFTR